MSQVTVFNPSNGPVTIDNARCIGGAEKATVELTPMVESFIAKGVLLRKDIAVSPQPDPEPIPDEVVDTPSIVDGTDDEPPVSSEVEDADQPTEDATETQPKPASMKRRRKTPPVKE